jgi:hypothetical protein
MICGIVAHVKDRGVASVALRSMAIAAEVLTVRDEQEEVLRIFEKVRKETGWNIGFLRGELEERWGWHASDAPQGLTGYFQGGGSMPAPNPHNPSTNPATNPLAVGISPAPPPTARPKPPSGVLNPLLKSADFSLPGHPYGNHYQPPNPNRVSTTDFRNNMQNPSVQTGQHGGGGHGGENHAAVWPLGAQEAPDPYAQGAGPGGYRHEGGHEEFRQGQGEYRAQEVGYAGQSMPGFIDGYGQRGWGDR